MCCLLLRNKGLSLIDDKKTLHDGINRIGYLRVFLNRLWIVVCIQSNTALSRLAVLFHTVCGFPPCLALHTNNYYRVQTVPLFLANGRLYNAFRQPETLFMLRQSRNRLGEIIKKCIVINRITP